MKFNIIFLIIYFFSINLFSQESLESILSEIDDSESSSAVTSTFKSTRIINGHSVELASPKSLEFRIAHRFGPINNGFYDIFGLDAATIKMSFEYGINDKMMAGFGRSSYQKSYDIFFKIALMKQTKGVNSKPFSLYYVNSESINTLRYDPKISFQNRISYSHQLLLAKKINDKFAFQLSPSLVFSDFENYDKHSFFIVGAAGKYMLSKRMALNIEYFYRLKHENDNSVGYINIFENNYNSLSIGIDIETGGHVFQLHFSNSSPMIEKGFLLETNKSWSDGTIHFGFNISREFSIGKKSSKKEW